MVHSWRFGNGDPSLCKPLPFRSRQRATSDVAVGGSVAIGLIAAKATTGARAL
jgi:hypothetical protein